MSRAPDDGRYMERQVLLTTPDVQVDDEGRLSYSTESTHVPSVRGPLDYPGGKNGMYQGSCSCGDHAGVISYPENRALRAATEHADAKNRNEAEKEGRE